MSYQIVHLHDFGTAKLYIFPCQKHFWYGLRAPRKRRRRRRDEDEDEEDDDDDEKLDDVMHRRRAAVEELKQTEDR